MGSKDITVVVAQGLIIVMEKVCIILFTRYPVPGEVKTRLIPTMGAEGAAQMHKSMAEFMVRQMQDFASDTSCTVHIYYTGGTLEQMQAWLGSQYTYKEQIAGNLGQRIQYAFAQAFAHGAEKVLLMGADCPDSRAQNMREALQLLDTAPCVLGPAKDGGYYLVALKTPMPDLFENIAWGTDSVLASTLAKLRQYALLPTLSDVDYQQDVPEKISVIIPTYNEETQIEQTIQNALQGFRVEVIVADGGSLDATCELARDLGVSVCSCPPEHRGRARQMNFAMQMAQGDIVLFLHADSLLPPLWDMAVRESMVGRESFDAMRLGHFRFAVSGDFWGKKLLTWGTNIRARCLRKPYGDQGFFLRREHFLALGGYDEVPFLEDVLFTKKVKAVGELCEVDMSLLTSGRRWQDHGFFRVTMLNQFLLIAAAWGVDLHILQRVYRKGLLYFKR